MIRLQALYETLFGANFKTTAKFHSRDFTNFKILFFENHKNSNFLQTVFVFQKFNFMQS